MKVRRHLWTLFMWSFTVWLLLLPALQGRAASSYDRLIVSAAHRHELEPALVKAVIECESHFDPQAVSPRGAQGLMQLMPATQVTLGVADAFDPWHNIEAGVRYLASLQQTFGTHVPLLLAAYNAGPQAVIDAGYVVPPFAETQDYVSCVLSARQRYRTQAFNMAEFPSAHELAAAPAALTVAPIRFSHPVARVGHRLVLRLDVWNAGAQVAQGVVSLTYPTSSVSLLALHTTAGETTVQLPTQQEPPTVQGGHAYQFLQGRWEAWAPGQQRTAALALVPRLARDIALHLSVLLYDSTQTTTQHRWSTIVRLPVAE
jgi:Transglycosylase SLT domain